MSTPSPEADAQRDDLADRAAAESAVEQSQTPKLTAASAAAAIEIRIAAREQAAELQAVEIRRRTTHWAMTLAVVAIAVAATIPPTPRW